MPRIYHPGLVERQPGEPVGPIKAIGNFVRKGTTFSGRASRSEYWWIMLLIVVIGGPLNYASEHDLLEWPNATGAAGIVVLVLALLSLLATALLVIFSIALSVRRLHDCNLSGWWFLLVLLPGLGQFALLILAALPPDPHGVRFDPQPARTPAVHT
ncbi:DUF805 domain-containing protein [Kocuria sp.]|uniref:DUF805 domain-containing protein n=1 Tax=Kocuria sp. TaxID=1871328 RepID=UPI0026DBE410|nr:DUF805 domain-containing protein [Kocuria sp.]MDO4918000.1 DUF805 domain-containing protein [Kocuria sp.]